jgi:nucleoside-diphosphate-sugar epimerase
MKVFVTGATGFVGTNVCSALQKENHEVIGLTSKAEKAPQLSELGITPVVGDMADESVVAPVAEKADATIMCAGVSGEGRLTRAKMREYGEAEVQSIQAVVKGAARHKRRVIYTSGYLVYGVSEDGWSRESEGFDPPEFSEGGTEASKYLLDQVARGNVNGCMIACGFVYGPAGFFATLVSQIREGKFRMPKGGDYYWSPVYEEDLARAYMLTLDGRADGKGLIVVDDEPMLMRDIMYTIAEAVGAKRPGSVPGFIASLFIGSAMVDGVTTSRRSSNELAKRVLDWKPRFPSFKEGLPKVLEQLEQEQKS